MAEIIGSAAIEIKAKDKNFENEVRKIAGKIKKVEVPVDAVVNTDLAKKQLESFRKSQQSRRMKLYVDVDTRKATTTLNKFIKSYSSKDVKLGVGVDTESVLEAATLLDDFQEQYHNKSIDMEVTVNDTVKDSLDSIKNTTDAIDDSVNKNIRLDVDSASANAQLITTAALAQATRRAISAPMRMNIDKQTLDGIKGFFYTLTGGIPIDKVRTALTGLAANFEGISVKSGIVSSSVLALAGTLSHAVGDLLTIGGDVTQVVGLLNAAPAGLAAGGLALTGTILGWKGFGEALMGEGKEAAEAMKLLPPEAQKAVKALDGVGSSIRRTTQTRYWKGMGTAVQDVMGAIRKDLDVGMGNAGEALGGQMSAIFGAMQEFGESGGLSNTFRDLTEFFKTSTPALAGFTSGFLDLMEGGAREMPAFGSWLSELGTGFSNWAKEANESGSINIWIQEASQRMKELGKVTQAAYGMFSGLTSAARNAGMNGLTELASGMVDVSNAMNTPAFQAGLTSFFTSVRVGAANAMPGMGNFFEMIGKGLPTINTAIEDSGIITGNMFDNFARMFENGNMGQGFLSMLGGMKDATATLAPGFESLGNALGGLMEVSGEVLRNVAPGLNQLFETVDVVVNNMKGGIIDAMPVFNEFIQGLLAGIRSVVGPLASLAGTMLSTFASLPGPIQTAMMSIGGFLGATALIQKKMQAPNSAIGAFATNTRNRFSGLATSVAASVGAIGNSMRGFGSVAKFTPINDKTIAQSNSAVGKLIASQRNAANQVTSIWSNVAAKNNSISLFGQSFLSGSTKNTLSGLGQTSAVVGKQITNGVGKAVGGLMGALGGPWGLAITAGVAGLATFGQASAESKQQLEEYYQLIQKDNGIIGSASKERYASDLFGDSGSMIDKINSWGQTWSTEGANVGKTLEKTGLQANSLIDSLVGGNGEQVLDTWRNLGAHAGTFSLGIDGVAASAKLSDQQIRDMGISSREALESMDSAQLGNLVDQLVNIGDQSDEARARYDNLKKSFAETANLQVADNRSVLESQISSAEEKLAAFKSNLQLGGLEQLSSQAGFYQLGQVTDQNNQKLITLKDTLKASGKELSSTFNMEEIAGTNVAMFDMTTQAGRQMFEVVGSQADGIHSAMMSSYDTVLKQTGNLEQAQSAALATAQKDIGAFTTELRNAGLETEQIAQILDTAGLSDTDITMALKTEGIDEAISQAMAVEAAMQGLRTGDWSLSIDVMADEAKAQIADTLGLAESATSQDIVQNIRAKFDNIDQYNSWMTEFNRSIPEQRARMVAELVNGEQAKSAIDAITSKGGELDGQTWTSAINVVDEGSKATVDQIYSAINLIPKETLAKITAEVQGDPTAELDAVLGSKEFKATLKAVLEGDPAAELDGKLPKEKKVPVKAEMTGNLESELNLAVGDGVKVPVTPDVQNMPSISSMFGGAGGASEVSIATKFAPPTNLPDVTVPDVTINTTANTAGVDQVRSSVDSISDKNVSVTVTANESNLNSIRDTMNSLTNKTVSVNVQANESNLNNIKSSMDALTNKNVSVNVTANESNLNSIRDTMNSLTNKSVSVNVKANSGGIQQIQSAMNSLVSKTVSVNIKANAGPVNSIRAAMASIVNKNVTVAVNASTGPVNALRSAISSIVNKTVTITANAPTGAVNALRAAIASVNGKTVSVIANTNVGAVYAMRAAIASVQSKTVTVTTRTRTVGENANGGMYMGGIRTFARGGIDDPRIAKAIERAQRRSGSENHTAQIARGSNNFRVWGEPETGGEAYIPLALSKRLRSLKILEQVASHFGVSLSQYADGGLIAGNKVASNVTTFASGGTTKATKKTAAQKKAEEAEKKRKEDLKELNKTIKESISDLKKALSDGLSDLKSAFGQADRSPVQKALDGMRKGVRDFRSDTSKQIKEAKKLGKSTKTMSAQLKASSKVDKAITKQMYSSKVWNRKGSNLQDSQYIANDAQRRQRDRRVDYNSKFTLRDYELAINNINKDLEKQQDKYDTMVKNHRSNMESISGNLFKQFDISSLIESKDSFGYRPPTTARDISSYATKMLSDMKKFSTNLNALRKAGYNEAIINQISQMSLEEALVVSQALLSDKSKMKNINSSFTQMFGKNGDMNIGSDGSTYVGGLARSIGKTTANSMFKTGVDIQKGIVDGLTADVKALEKAGQTMAEAIHRGYTKTLKINSPSKLFRETSKAIPEGVVQGIDSGRGIVDSSISNLVQPRRLNLTGSGSQSAKSSGIINGNGGTNPVTVNVYPSEGMSERQIGTTAAREIHYRLDAS